MARVMDFFISEDDCFRIADEAFDAGDFARSLTFARRLVEMNPHNAAGNLLLGDLYREFGEAEIALKTYLSHYADAAGDEEYVQAVVGCLLELREYDDAEKYLRSASSLFTEEELNEMYDELDFEEGGQPRFRVAEAGDDEHVAAALNRARELLMAGDLDAAEREIEGIETSNDKLLDTVLCARIVLAATRGDVDAIIAEGELVRESTEDVYVLCLIASAYFLQNLEKEANVVVQRLLTVTPVISNEIKQLLFMRRPNEAGSRATLADAELILSRFPMNLSGMILKSIALFNLGDRQDAVAEMKNARSVYGDSCDADYYLKLFEELEGKDATLCFGVTSTGSALETRRHSLTRELNSLSRLRLSQAQSRIATDEYYSQLLVRALRSTDDTVVRKALAVLHKVRTRKAHELLTTAMTDVNVSREARLDCALCVLTAWGELDAPVLVGYFWTELRAYLPNNFAEMPFVFQAAYVDCMRTIIQDTQLPNDRAADLEEVFTSFAEKRAGVLNWGRSVNSKKAVRLRSVPTLAAVLFYVVNKSDFTIADVCADFCVKQSTFKNYLAITGLEDY